MHWWQWIGEVLSALKRMNYQSTSEEKQERYITRKLNHPRKQFSGNTVIKHNNSCCVVVSEIIKLAFIPIPITSRFLQWSHQLTLFWKLLLTTFLKQTSWFYEVSSNSSLFFTVYSHFQSEKKDDLMVYLVKQRNSRVFQISKD